MIALGKWNEDRLRGDRGDAAFELHGMENGEMD
jgi:hypothetical protein